MSCSGQAAAVVLVYVVVMPGVVVLPFRGEDGCFLYGVFNGYDGSRVASYVSQFLTAELLLGQLNSTHTDDDVRRLLTQVCVCRSVAYCVLRKTLNEKYEFILYWIHLSLY